MRRRRAKLAAGIGTAMMVVLLGGTPTRAQIGDSVGGVGPINRSMGGAAVAAPIDAAGALYWNPATIAGLSSSELETALELIIIRTSISSRLSAGALGPGIPSQTMFGHTGGNDGVVPLPVVGLVYRSPDNPFWTYGIGLFPVAGFTVNYPTSRTNPVLQPQAPYGLGLGPIYSNYQLLQIAPTVACQLTDQLSLGAAVNLDMSALSVNPAVFGTPTPVATPLGPSGNYPPGTDGRYRWGGGFQVGAYFDPGGDWKFGAAVKSPQWFDTYSYNSVTVNGKAARPTFNLDFPLTASVGTAYTGIERLLVALDLRFLDFRDTNGFRHAGFTPSGAATGLGWQNIFALALGAQYQLTDALTFRAGYTFNLDGASNAVTMFNLLSPTIIQHSVACGLTYNVTKSFRLSLAYVHFFENSIEGPIVTPRTGPIPLSAVKTSATADSVLLGASVSF